MNIAEGGHSDILYEHHTWKNKSLNRNTELFNTKTFFTKYILLISPLFCEHNSLLKKSNELNCTKNTPDNDWSQIKCEIRSTVKKTNQV